MRLEDLRIALRPRRPWESMDLGLTMLQTWWKPVYAVWLILTVPVFILVSLVLDIGGWAYVVMWWLKPAFDRPLLHIYSRAVFGAVPSVRETLRELPRLWLRSGLLWHLTLGRVLDPARSYRLPVLQLEGLRGRARRDRLRVMGARDTGYGVGMTLVYFPMELILAFGFLVLGIMLLPVPLSADPFEVLSSPDTSHRVLGHALAFAGMTLIEPAFVAGGFGLYLNRRTILEAWDLELSLRRIAQRLAGLRSPAGNTAAMVLLGALVSGLLASAPSAALAETPPVARYDQAADAATVIERVLADPTFGHRETVKRWRWRERDDEAPVEAPDLAALKGLGELLAAAIEAVFWVLGAALVAAFVYYLLRHAGPLQALLGDLRRSRRASALPDEIGGLRLDPDTLPDDVAAGARALWAGGEPRAALSLLYRGSIVRLLETGLRLPESATEGDVLRHADGVLEGEAQGCLRQLVRAWQTLAYAHRAPDERAFAELCDGYRVHFHTAGSDGRT